MGCPLTLSQSLVARRLRQARVADPPAHSRRLSAPPRSSHPVSSDAIDSSSRLTSASVSAVDRLALLAALESGWPRLPPDRHSLRDVVSSSPGGLRHPDELPMPTCAHGPSYERTRRAEKTALKNWAHK